MYVFNIAVLPVVLILHVVLLRSITVAVLLLNLALLRPLLLKLSHQVFTAPLRRQTGQGGLGFLGEPFYATPIPKHGPNKAE